jgi:uncharacterized protein
VGDGVPDLTPLLAAGLALLFVSAVEAATGYGSALVALPVMELAFPPLSFAAGLGSGFMGTATGMSGPPLAVVFAHEHGPTVRATLGLVYGIGSAFSVGALMVARRIDATDLELAALLAIPVVVGFAAGRLLLKRGSRRFLHVAIVAVVAACAVMLSLGAI